MLTNTAQINVEDTINSGQVFLWEKYDKTWYGVNGNDVFCVNQEPFEVASFSKKPYDLFRFGDNFDEIRKSIGKDMFVRDAIRNFPGLRLLRQDPFQCYISFIVSANSSIHNIKQVLYRLCKKFGNKVEFDGKEFFLFPEPQKIANAQKKDLLACGLGYRAKAVKIAARAVVSGKIDFSYLKKTDYHTAKESLVSVFGIGDKVADCIILFSLEKLEAFPLDRWILRVLQKYYSNNFQLDGKTLTKKRYGEIHKKIVDHFGPYAGYAQQFLFKMERDLNQKKWL